MPKYNVHLYREMRIYFTAIEADTPLAAALIADGSSLSDAQLIDDCDSASTAALVDLQGDDEYHHSQMIDLQPRARAARLA
jgi:hypothetical protein